MKISLKNDNYIKSNNNMCVYHVLGCTRGHKFHKPIKSFKQPKLQFFLSYCKISMK